MNSRRFLVRVSTLKRDILNETMNQDTSPAQIETDKIMFPHMTEESMKLLRRLQASEQKAAALERELTTLRHLTGAGSVNGLMKSVQRFQQKERDGTAQASDLDVLVTQVAEFLRQNMQSDVCILCNNRV